MSRALIVAMAAVVLLVSASALYARYRLSNTAEALAIAADAAPSVHELASARMHLHRLAFELDRAITAPDGPAPLAAADGEHQRFHDALARYLALPLDPGERELRAELGPAVAALDGAYTEALARAHGGDLAAARAAVLQRVDPEVVSVDERLADLEALNGDLLARRTRDIERTQRRYDLFVYALFGASFVVAAVATLLVIRVLRRYVVVLDRRARELEYFALQIGHDVLNPLTPIGAGLHLARDGGDGEAVRQAVERGLRGVDRIQRNIAGLLAFARAGERSAADARAPIKRCLDDVVADLAEGAGAPIVIERIDDAAARCDDGVLSRVLRAMLADALARSGGGAVRVRALALRGRVRVEIAGGPALGRGVDPFAPRIRGLASGYPGIELEMLTARRLVETHGGRVGAAAAAGSCVTFVELPS